MREFESMENDPATQNFNQIPDQLTVFKLSF